MYIKLCECVVMVFQVRNLLKKGLPLKIRPRVWKLFLNSEAPKQQNHFDYQVALAHTYTYYNEHAYYVYLSLDLLSTLVVM